MGEIRKKINNFRVLYLDFSTDKSLPLVSEGTTGPAPMSSSRSPGLFWTKLSSHLTPCLRHHRHKNGHLSSLCFQKFVDCFSSVDLEHIPKTDACSCEVLAAIHVHVYEYFRPSHIEPNLYVERNPNLLFCFECCVIIAETNLFLSGFPR